MNDYKIELGIGLKSQDFNNIKADIKSLEDKPIRLEIDAETKELTQSIQDALKALSKGGQNAFTIDTSKFDESIKDIKTAVLDLQKTFGSLGDNVNMKDLLSSVNQIANAIGKVTDESETLSKSLSALSKKDFGFNFNLKTGNANPLKAATDYGQAASRKAIPAIKEQINYLKDVINVTMDADKALQRYLMKQHKGYAGMQLKNSLEKQVLSGYNLNGEKVSKSDRMVAGEELIGYYKEIAALNNISLDGFNSKFSKSATEIVDDTTKIQTGVKQTEEAVESAVSKMKQMFGGGIGAEQLSTQLQPIVDDLHSIQEAITALSKDTSLGGLTNSFNRLAESIENLLANAEKVKGVLNSGFDTNAIGDDINSIKSPKSTRRRTQSEADEYLNGYLKHWNIKGENAKTVKGKFEAFSQVSSRGVGDELYEAALDDLMSTLRQLGSVSKTVDDDAKKLLATLKGYNIDAPKDKYKSEFGDDWKNIKNKYKILKSGTGIPVDAAYQELSGASGFSSYFPDDIWNEYDQLRKIIEVYDELERRSKNRKVNISDEYTDTNLRNQVLDIVSVMQEQSEAEQKVAQASTQTANTISQNENQVRQEYEKTLAQKKQRVEEIDGLFEDYAQKMNNPDVLQSDNALEIVQGYSDQMDILQQERDGLVAEIQRIEAALKNEAQQSQETANTVIRNEERKQQAIRQTQQLISNSVKKSIDNVSSQRIGKYFEIDKSNSNDFQREIEGLVRQWTNNKGNLVDVKIDTRTSYDKNVGKNIERLHQAQVTYNNELGETIKKTIAWRKIGSDIGSDGKESPVYGFAEVAGRYSKSIGDTTNKANNFVKQQKNAVANLTNQIEQMNRAANDQNAPRAIKDESHLNTLSSKYNDIISAIQRMSNASSDTFIDEQNNVKRLISEYKSLVSEMRNIENVATSLRSKDINTVKDTYSSKLDVLVSKMRKDGVYTSGFEKGAENLRLNLANATDASGLIAFLNGLDKLEAGYKRASSSAKEFNQSQKVGIKISGLQSQIADIQRISPEIDQFETEINGARVTVKSLLNDLGQVKTQGDFSVVNSRFKAFTDAAKASGIAIKESANEIERLKSKADSLSTSASMTRVDNQYANTESSLNKLAIKIPEIKASFSFLTSAYNELTSSQQNYKNIMSNSEATDEQKIDAMHKLVNANKEYQNALETTNNLIAKQNEAETKSNNISKLEQQKAQLSLQMNNWLKSNSAAAKQFGGEIRNLQSRLNACDDVQFDGIKREFNILKQQAKETGKTGQTFIDGIKSQFSKYSQYFSVASLFMYVQQGLRSMFEQVKLIDSAMTELKKVTDETDASYNKFLSNAAKRSKELGTTIDGLVSSTADFARLGYGFKDAQGLAEVANIYAVVGDEIEGVEGATESLISTMAAFKQTQANMSNSEFAMNIVDKFNEVSNNYAISSGGLGEALKRSASALFSANNSLDESIAMLTASNTVVQNPETVGQAYKTIALRIRGAKSELEEMGEDTEGVIESSSKLREEILALSGVDIMEADGQTFKSTYKILDEISKVYKDLSDVSQANILEIFAGKRQSNILSAALENFQVARDALNTSLGSEGSALKEHEKASQSLEFKLNSLKASWQSFAQTFMESDTLKAGVDALAGLVDVLEKLIDNFGLLGTISLGVAGKGLWNYFRGAKEAKATLNDVVRAIRETSNATKEASDVSVDADKSEISSSKQVTEAKMQEKAATDASTQSDLKETQVNNANAASENAEANASRQSTQAEREENIENAKAVAAEKAEKRANDAGASAELKEGMASAKSATQEAAENLQNIEASATEANEAIANLGTAMTETAESTSGAANSFKNFASSSGGIMAIIGLIIAGISALIQHIQKTKEEISQARQEAIQASDEFLDASVSFERAYVKYSGKTDLTESEEAELASAINSTVDALNDKSSALQGVVNSSGDYLAALERITDAELKAAENAAKEKKDKSKLELEDIANGWISGDSSEVSISLGNYTVDTDFSKVKKEIQIAKEVGGKYFVQGIEGRDNQKYSNYLTPPSHSNAGIEEILEFYHILEKYQDRLSEEGLIDTSAYNQTTSKIKEMKSMVEAYESSVYEVVKAQYQLNKGIPKTAEEYLRMRNAILSDEEIKNMSFDTKQMIANSLDSDLGQAFDLGTIRARARKFVGVIKGFGDGSIDGSNEIGTVETFLNMQTAVNNNECTVGEYLSELNNVASITENFSDEEKEAFNLEFGIDTDAVKEQYENMQNYLYRKGNNVYDKAPQVKSPTEARDDINKFLNSLTADELVAVVDIRTEIDWENTSAEDIRKLIEDRVKLNEALNFNANIEVDKTSLEALNTVLEESASAMGLSEESIDSLKSKYKDLEGYNPHTLFEKTANGVKVNREELAKLEKKYNDLTKTEVQEHLDTLVEEYNKCTKAIDSNIGSQEKLELISKREKYAQQIEELAEYQAQLEGVTGAYQKWIDAQNTPEDYEGYESVATGKEDIQEEIDRGFISNKGKAYIDLLSGENLEGKSIDDYYNAWEKLDKKVGSTSYSIHDFFTVNDDGDITSAGIDRFFKGLQQDFKGSVAEFNEKTGQWEYNFSQENLQKIQDEWGLGIEAIELLLEAAASAGYDVDWGGIFENLDLDTSNFESLVSVAEAAQKELNKLKGYEDIDFNFSTTTVEAATSELDRAQKVYNELVTDDDGTINLDAKGADNVRVILATLLVQKQQLEDSEIAINISTSGLDDSQEKAVTWVQDFRAKYKNLEIAISTGEGIEEAKTELETVKTSLGELDGDTAKIAAKLVLGEDTDTDGVGFKSQVNNAIDSIGKQDINVGFKLDETSISNLNSSLLNNFTVSATAKITKVDESQLKTVETGGMVNWTENTDGVSKSFEADGTVNWDDNVKNVKTSFSASGTVKWTSGNNVKVKVISEANGTANANGTTGHAFARGNWGIKGSGTALVGELGRRYCDHT